MRLSKEAKEFIFDLLIREIDAEYIHNSEKPLEIEYVRDLIRVSKEFGREYAKDCGFIYGFAILDITNTAIDRLIKGE